MNRLFIVGAGGFAREIYSYLSETNFIYQGYRLEALFSDYGNDLDNYNLKHQLLTPVKNKHISKNDAVILGVADPIFKENLYKFYKKLDCKILTFVHSTASVGLDVEVGEGSVLCPNCSITTDIKIGRCVTINAHSTVGHDASIGDFSTLSGHCDVTGFVQLGEKVFMGSHATIIPSRKIGNEVVIGAGSVVISNLKPNITVFGNPAKKIR